jgi:hypothetical protein
MTSINELIPVLQMAIGPVILISGIGLLLLSMTNRLGRIIDRVRVFTDELQKAPSHSRAPLEAQLLILWRRGRLIRAAITLSSISALAAALLIIVLFLIALFQIEFGWVIVMLFIICMGCLIASLIVFIKDINHSLTALKLELRNDGIC